MKTDVRVSHYIKIALHYVRKKQNKNKPLRCRTRACNQKWHSGSIIQEKIVYLIFFFFSAHLKASRSLSLLAWQRAGRPQEAKHLVHHVGVVDGLQTGLLHLLHHLLLPANLLLLLLLSLSVFFRQLGQTLLEIKMYLYSLDG